MRRLIACMVAGLAGLAPAQDYTVVNAPDDDGPGIGEMLSWALGGSFVEVGDRDFGSGSFMATRMRDYGAGNDQIWNAGIYRVESQRHEDHNHRRHRFGYVEGTSGNLNTSAFNRLLSGEGPGETATVAINEDFRWAAQFQQGNFRTRTTQPGDNPGEYDHYITYTITNETGRFVGWMMFVENEEFSNNPDGDFNDLALLLTLTPTPHAAGLGALGLLGMAGLTRRRRAFH